MGMIMRLGVKFALQHRCEKLLGWQGNIRFPFI